MESREGEQALTGGGVVGELDLRSNNKEALQVEHTSDCLDEAGEEDERRRANRHARRLLGQQQTACGRHGTVVPRQAPNDASIQRFGDSILRTGAREGGGDGPASPSICQNSSTNDPKGAWSSQRADVAGLIGFGACGRKNRRQGSTAVGPEAGPYSNEAARPSRAGPAGSDADLGEEGWRKERQAAPNRSDYDETASGQQQAAGVPTVARGRPAPPEAFLTVGEGSQPQLSWGPAGTGPAPGNKAGSGPGMEPRTAQGPAIDQDVDVKARDGKRVLLPSDLPPGCAPLEAPLVRQPNRDSSHDGVDTGHDLRLQRPAGRMIVAKSGYGSQFLGQRGAGRRVGRGRTNGTSAGAQDDEGSSVRYGSRDTSGPSQLGEESASTQGKQRQAHQPPPPARPGQGSTSS